MKNYRLIALAQVKDAAWIIEKWLQRTSEYADAIVMLDDGSTDGTYEILKEHPKVIRLLRNPPGTRPELGRNCLGTDTRHLIASSGSVPA